jgi:hypothetical protein
MQIANNSLQKKKTEYPTMDDVISDWGDVQKTEAVTELNVGCCYGR